MQPQLERVRSELREAQDRLHRVLADLPPTRWAERSRSSRWSVAECVEHLNLTGRAYVPILRSALEEARALDIPAPERYRRDFIGWLLARLAGPLPRIGGVTLGRVPTTAPFVPREIPSREAAEREFDRLQDEQIGIVEAAEGLPIDRVRIGSPFNEQIRYNVYSAFVVLPRHQMRHLDQAEEVWSR